MNALDISSITFSYEGATVCALQNVSLTVTDGRIQALLGPNGAGKSTLMRIVTGQMRGYSGDVSVYGTKMPDRSALLSIGYAPQPISLYTSLTARENLAFLRSDGRTCRTNKLHCVRKSCWNRIGLTDHAEEQVATYSGGMQRRLNLAVALLHSPKLLLLDEPTVGVDPQSRNHIYDTLMELNAAGMTILLSTHIMEEAQRLCSSVTLADKGEVIFDGPMSGIR